jgi:uncharacterized caspase-like protein/uncharacterized Zn-binding protein involved in type VI secretion
MKPSPCLRIIRFLAALTSAVALCDMAQAQDRVALVVGNSKYINANIVPNAVNDARVMARTLREIGFGVADGYDLSRDNMERQIREFLRRSESARVALFFYAGHGLQVDGRNYLLPVNTKLEAASDLGFETIGLDSVLESLDGTLRTNIIILDACRNNPFAQSFASRFGAARSVTVLSGLAGYANLGAGTLIAFSTAPGAVALDGDGSNSPFTKALAQHVRTPGLEVRQMLTRVRADVAAETRGRQIPWDNSSLLGEVYLVGLGKPEPQRVDVSPAAPSTATDDVLWEAIKNSGVAAVFEEFANRFPTSRHAREAQGRLEELNKSQLAMLPPASGAQIGKLSTVPANAPIASFMRHNSGWSVAFSFAEPVTGISWRLGETGNFRETGFIDAYGAAGGAPVVEGSPNVFINGRPAAITGARTGCGGVVIGGSSNVFINGKPAAQAGGQAGDCRGR